MVAQIELGLRPPTLTLSGHSFEIVRTSHRILQLAAIAAALINGKTRVGDGRGLGSRHLSLGESQTLARLARASRVRVTRVCSLRLARGFIEHSVVLEPLCDVLGELEATHCLNLGE